MAKSDSVFDYFDPYSIMVGRWSGTTTVYNAQGIYQDTIASLVTVSWLKPGKVLRYEQHELADLDKVLTSNTHKAAVDQIINHDFDLKVDGKACTSIDSHKEKVSLKGAETRPGTYLFHLTFPEGDYYNNQFFSSPNERHIIGPFLPAGSGRDFGLVVAQTFTRISYEVPKPASKKPASKKAGKAR